MIQITDDTNRTYLVESLPYGSWFRLPGCADIYYKGDCDAKFTLCIVYADGKGNPQFGKVKNGTPVEQIQDVTIEVSITIK